ncbi:MAG: hypothetical protein GY835_09435 [bacterium]|nr:hypothetical protein [bacterium]
MDGIKMVKKRRRQLLLSGTIGIGAALITAGLGTITYAKEQQQSISTASASMMKLSLWSGQGISHVYSQRLNPVTNKPMEHWNKITPSRNIYMAGIILASIGAGLVAGSINLQRIAGDAQIEATDRRGSGRAEPRADPRNQEKKQEGVTDDDHPL